MNTSIKKIAVGLFGLSVLAMLVLPASVGAVNSEFSLTNSAAIIDSAGNSAGLSGANNLPTIIGRIISVALGILGIAFLGLVIYAGFLYLTAQGEETPVKKAKNILKQAIIGMILIVTAYAITNVVTNALSTIASEPATPVGYGDHVVPADSGSVSA